MFFLLLFSQACALHSPCGAVGAEWEQRAPSASRDRTCANVSSCERSLAFEYLAPTRTRDRLCRRLTQCRDQDGLEFENRAPTASSDRVCARSTRCNASTEYETSARAAPDTYRVQACAGYHS